jgi:mono/diheme cytochrome c family protein
MMIRIAWLCGLAILAAASTGAAATVGQSAQNQVAAGRELAAVACAACHQITPEQRKPPRVTSPDDPRGIEAPSFMEIAHVFGRDVSGLRQMITRPHYPMREQSFDPGDLDGIIAYIESLHRSGRQ